MDKSNLIEQLFALLTDIARILERYPQLRSQVPDEVLARLL